MMSSAIFTSARGDAPFARQAVLEYSGAGLTSRSERGRFCPVSYVTGDVSADGSAILLRVRTETHDEVDLSFPTVDLQHLVTLLLILGGKAAVRGRFAAFSETFQAPPLPLHGVSLGLDESEGVLTLEVGATVLSFSLSRRAMAEIGHTIRRLDGPADA